MSKILAKKLGFSLGFEDDAPAADITINVETDEEGTPLAGTTLDGENTVETDQVEVAEAEGEVDETNDQVEELEEAQETLENYYVALEHYNRNGGMGREAAAMMTIGIEGVVRKYGITPKDLNISVESFGDNRQRATTVSMEGIRDMLAELWKNIKELMFKMWKSIKNFYMKIFSGAVRLKKRAEAINKKAKSETRPIKEKKIEVGLLKQLHISGKAPEAQAITNTLDVYLKATDAIGKGNFDETTKELVAIIEAAESAEASRAVGKAVGDLKAKVKSSAPQVLPNGSNVTEVVAKRLDNSVEAGALTDGKMSQELLGGKIMVVLNAPANTGGGLTNLRATLKTTKFGFVSYTDKSKEMSSSTSFNTLSASAVVDITDKIMDIAENVRLYEKVWDKRDAMLKEVNTAGDKAVKAVESDEDIGNGRKKYVKEAIEGTTSLLRNLTSFEKDINSRALSTSGALLNLCVASLRAHGE
jgi:hypothetical protein